MAGSTRLLESGILILFCLYLAIYHGVFGLLMSLLAGKGPLNLRALLLSPVLWVAVELARTRITGFPWGLLGTTQVDNIPLTPHRLGYRRLRAVVRNHAGECGLCRGVFGAA